MTIRRSTAALAVLSAVLLLLVTVAVAGAASQRAFVTNLTLTGDQEVIGGAAPCAPPTVCGDPDAVGTARVQIVPALDRVCVRIDWAVRPSFPITFPMSSRATVSSMRG